MGCSYASQARTPNTLDGGPKSATPATGSPGRLLDNYQLGKVLGQGAFGIVYYCKKKGSREEYAVKMIDKVETPLVGIKHEVKMLQDLKHSSIVVLHDVFYEKAFVCIVMTIYKGGDMIEGMQRHWKKHGMLPIPVVASLIKQMITSLDWLHKHCVVHRDVKGDNFLMDCKDIADPECRIVLSDFGTARTLETPTARLKSRCGTKTYWAPEFYAMNYGLKVDVWALGIIMYGLVTGRFPFKGEDDVKNKKISTPSRATTACGQLLMALLDRNEQKRITAQDALAHQFCKGATTPAPTAGANDSHTFEIQRDRVDTYQLDRRYFLMQAMQDAENQNKMMTALQLKVRGSAANPLQVVHHNGKSKLQWYDTFKARSLGLLDHPHVQPLGDDDAKKNAQTALKNMEAMFKDHWIESTAFGAGQAKTLDEFNLEIQKGAALLLLDASKHKKDKPVVRVVDLVLLRIAAKASNGAVEYMLYTNEKFPDGRERKDLYRLPGTKKEPHENAMQTIHRFVQERMQKVDVKVDFTKKETYEEDTTSPSYPGIRTVYRTEIFDGTLVNASLERQFTATDTSRYERTYSWISEEECNELNVRLKGDTEKEFSSLVHAPIIPKEEEILKQFQDAGVHYKGWPAGKFKVMTDELAMGKAALVNVEGKLLRAVDVVVVKVTKDAKEVLVEVEEEVGDPSGEVKRSSLNRLPAVKRRPDENMYVAAKRCIHKHLIDENAVTFDTGSVLIVEEEKESQTFPGLKCLYRKRIITANLVADESSIIIHGSVTI